MPEPTAIEEWEVVDLLTALVDKSLVAYDAETDRYRLLETVRQYARDRLLEGGDGERWRERQQEFVLSLAEAAAPHLSGPDQGLWLDRLESERANLRAALEWRGGENALRLVAAAWRLWYVRAHFDEGRRLVTDTLASSPGAPPLLRAAALNAAGSLAARQGDYFAARELHEEALSLRRESGDRAGEATSLANLALTAYEAGEYEPARLIAEESVALSRELGDEARTASPLLTLGLLALRDGDLPGARRQLEASLALSRRVGNSRGEAAALANLGFVAIRAGDAVGGRVRLGEALALFRELRDRVGLVDALEGLSAAIGLSGDLPRAARLWGAAQGLREELGSPLPAADREQFQKGVEAARRLIGADFDRAVAEGRTLSLAAALTLALEEPRSE